MTYIQQLQAAAAALTSLSSATIHSVSTTLVTISIDKADFLTFQSNLQHYNVNVTVLDFFSPYPPPLLLPCLSFSSAAIPLLLLLLFLLTS